VHVDDSTEEKIVYKENTQTGFIEYDGVVLVGCFKEGEKDA
jgi:hypothetical protein